MTGEDDIVRWIAGRQKANALVQVPAGDDLAVLKWPAGEGLLLAGADQVLDGVHFRSGELASWEAIGRKAMNRNLSDCAAMGCMPLAAVATVALLRGAAAERVRELYLGMEAAGAKYYCPIVGGDTATWDGPLAVTVAILARATGVRPLLRSGAVVGDGIYVTGPLGGSILGRHLTFEPRVHEGRLLAASKLPTAMLDVSDGLLKDLGRLLAASGGGEGLGAVIDVKAVPIHADAVTLAAKDGIPAWVHALTDGEDHELLFTSTARPPVGLRVGTVVAAGSGSDRITLKKEDGTEVLASLALAEFGKAGGWEHRLR